MSETLLINQLKKPEPLIMGIMNLSPGSFASQGRCLNTDEALFYAEQLVGEGADIIDLGAEPTNPGVHSSLSASDELHRLLPLIEAIKARFDVPLSVDTSEPKVMEACVGAGVDMINDVRALRREGALDCAVSLNVPVCLMHMAFPDFVQNKQLLTEETVLESVKAFLKERSQSALAAGIHPDHIILDPGFGGGAFGKDVKSHFTLLHALPTLASLGYPLLVGISRKSFIAAVLNDCPEAERVHASLALNLYAIQQGAKIIRTHDVKALRDSLTVLALI